MPTAIEAHTAQVDGVGTLYVSALANGSPTEEEYASGEVDPSQIVQPFTIMDWQVGNPNNVQHGDPLSPWMPNPLCRSASLYASLTMFLIIQTNPRIVHSACSDCYIPDLLMIEIPSYRLLT
eukprot:7184849-Pyramimonas_sp.AAC.1